MSGRAWTDREIAFLQQRHGEMPLLKIAELLGRSPSSTYQLAARLGLVTHRRRTPAERERLEAQIRRWHARERSDAEIAAKIGAAREWVSEVRRRMGLPAHGQSARFRRRVAANTRRQCRAAGVRSLAEIRLASFRRRAREAGWPEDLRPRAVQILEVLYQRGPMTRRQIAEAIGMPWKGSRKSLASNDPQGSYLAHLQARGLVVRLGRVVKGKGSGHSVNLYAVPLWIEKEKGIA